VTGYSTLYGLKQWIENKSGNIKQSLHISWGDKIWQKSLKCCRNRQRLPLSILLVLPLLLFSLPHTTCSFS
jgi:hypothetical protein